MRIQIVKPKTPTAGAGNDVTADRWARLLRELGHRVAVAHTYDGEPCDLLVTLHARKTAASALRFRKERPTAPLWIGLAGTDIYEAPSDDAELLRVLDAADRIIELQPLARLELPAALRSRVSTIFQSSEVVAERGSCREDSFDVCVIGHLRAVKDPFRTAAASRLVPAESRLRVRHIGAALDSEMEARALAEQTENPRYTWLGARSPIETARTLTASRLLVLSSRSEGGANVLSEAVVNDVPSLASRIPGNVGSLGDSYPGYFTPGETEELARLLWRAEQEPAFFRTLRDYCRGLSRRFDPASEREIWRGLLEELQADFDGESRQRDM